MDLPRRRLHSCSPALGVEWHAVGVSPRRLGTTGYEQRRLSADTGPWGDLSAEPSSSCRARSTEERGQRLRLSSTAQRVLLGRLLHPAADRLSDMAPLVPLSLVLRPSLLLSAASLLPSVLQLLAHASSAGVLRPPSRLSPTDDEPSAGLSPTDDDTPTDDEPSAGLSPTDDDAPLDAPTADDEPSAGLSPTDDDTPTDDDAPFDAPTAELSSTVDDEAVDAPAEHASLASSFRGRTSRCWSTAPLSLSG